MEEALAQLAKDINSKYYGKFRGFVSDNKDPEKRGRLRLVIPSVLGEAVSGWALPCLPFGGLTDMGFFTVPEVDAQVWVEFEEGDLTHPIWTGTFWQTENDTPAEAALEEPTTRLLKTASGHLLQFDDASGEERIHILHGAMESSLEFDKGGSVLLTDASGAAVTLDAEGGSIRIEDANGNTLTMDSGGTTIEDSNGNKVEMAASGMTVKGTQVVVEGSVVMLGGSGGEPLIKGSTFLSLFATHMHPTGVGPSGPPIPQGEASSLSSTVLST